MTPEAKRGAMHPPMPEDVRRGLHRPQVEKHPHTIRKIVATGLAAAGVIAYANFSDDVNKFVNGIFTGPFPTVTEAATPTPTEAVNDGLVIPEGLAVEDKQVRESMRLMVREGNAFELDVAEVKNYLATGETADLKTFEIAKDAEGKAAFVIVKGGNYGFEEKELFCVNESISMMNKIDSSIIRTIADKNGLKFFTTDIAFFEKNPNYGGTYLINNFGGSIFINPGVFLTDKDSKYYTVIGTLILESRALYSSNGFSNDGETTSAPDKLDSKIGIDKGLYLKNLSGTWFSSGCINEYGKECFDLFSKATIDYYSQN